MTYMTNEDEDKMSYATRIELLKAQEKLRKETSSQINDVNTKVDSLNNIVLPLVETSKATADNTKELVKTMGEFTKEQKSYNDEVRNSVHENEKRIYEHSFKIESIFEKYGEQSQADKDIKNANLKIIGVVITASGGIVVAIVKIAPLLFTKL